MAMCSFSVFAELKPPENSKENIGTRGDPIFNANGCKIEFPISAMVDGYIPYQGTRERVPEELKMTKEILINKIRKGSKESEYLGDLMWHGGCNSNGQADGRGEFTVKFRDMDGKIISAYRGGIPWMVININSWFKNGKVVGRVMTVIRHSYYDEGQRALEFIFYALDGNYFNSRRDMLEYKDPDIKKNRLVREAADQDMLKDFRNSLKPGVETSDGMVLEVDGKAAKIKTSRCIEYRYENCNEYANFNSWFQILDLYPREPLQNLPLAR